MLGQVSIIGFSPKFVYYALTQITTLCASPLPDGATCYLTFHHLPLLAGEYDVETTNGVGSNNGGGNRDSNEQAVSETSAVANDNLNG